jgi:hypothetical protein
VTFEERFPYIAWRMPQKVTVPGQGTWLACRICIAEKGLKAEDLPDVGFTTQEQFEAHLAQEHPQ